MFLWYNLQIQVF